MIIQNRTRAGWLLVRSCIRRSFPYQIPKWLRVTATAFIALAVIALFSGLIPEKARLPNVFKTQTLPESQKERLPSNTLETQHQYGGGSAQKAAQKRSNAKVADGAFQAATIETAPPASAQTREVVQNQLPALLGQVALKRNETLWRLVEKVYGKFSYQRQKSLLAANPQIADPNQIAAGHLISVPAIPVTVRPLSRAVWWVKIDEKSRLEEAIQILRSYPDEAPPIRLVPYWSPAKDTRFAVILREHFFNEATARDQLAQLSVSIAPQGAVLSGWGEDTIFFADPYLVNK
jgi:hypothetical protein